MFKYFILSFCFSFISNAQNITFSDANFKNALVNTNCVINSTNPSANTNADTNNDGEISVSEALVVEKLLISNQNISTINEISYFSNLKYLVCNNNLLTSLSFSNNNKLQYLNCDNNLLTSLSLYNVPNLAQLYCSGNSITNLDLSTTGFLEGSFSDNPFLQTIQLKNGIPNLCIVLLTQGSDYTCAMFLNCPALRLVCLDQEDVDNSIFYSNYPQELVVFNTNSNCTLSTEDFNTNKIKIYPNPFKDQLQLLSESNLSIEKITIYNSLGQIVYQNATYSENIDLSKLKSGYYYVELITDQGKKNQKVIKQ